MMHGIYTGAASLSALQHWQESISQNLASSSVAGFKKTEVSFDGLLSGSSQLAPDKSFSNLLLGQVPASTSRINFTAGPVVHTGKETDFAAQTPGFFQVKRGDGSTVYTRNGEFHINAENNLVTKQGFEVMGQDGPITIDPDKGPLTVGIDGTVSQEGTSSGKLALHDFPDTKVLIPQDGGYYLPRQGAAPTLVENPLINQGAIEGANVSPISEMVNLVSVSRAYEASQKIITSHDELLKEAIQTLGNPLT